MNPNEKQVGGSHYATGAGVQHWDYVMRALNGRYLEGNITKYVARHTKKNGLQDLKKAQHYLDKLIYEYGAGNVLAMRAPGQLTTAWGVGEFIAGAKLGHWEARICVALTQWSTVQDLEEVHRILKMLVAGYPHPEDENDGSHPGHTYVNPDYGTELPAVAPCPNPAVERQAAELFVQGYIPLVAMGLRHPVARTPCTVARIDDPGWVARLASTLKVPPEAFYQRGALPLGSDCGMWGEYWCHLYSKDRRFEDEEVFWRLHELCRASGRLANVRHVKKG